MLRLATCAVLLCGLAAATALAAEETALPTEKVRIPHSLVDIEMIKIPAGAIEMPVLDKKGRIAPGAEKVNVVIKSFWLGRTELGWEALGIFAYRLDLTVEESSALDIAEKDIPVAARSRPSKPYGNPDRGFGYEGFPAISIHYNTGMKFCVWLSHKTGQKYRLPTEAEWEFACRAGGPPLAPDKTLLDKSSWHAGNSIVESGNLQSHPVGQKEPNAWGLYDMLGNVGEWTSITDRIGVVKGATFMDAPEKINSSARALWNPDWQMRDPAEQRTNWWLTDGPHIGFRIVRED